MKVNEIWWAAYSRCTFVLGRGVKQNILENITADEADKNSVCDALRYSQNAGCFFCTPARHRSFIQSNSAGREPVI